MCVFSRQYGTERQAFGKHRRHVLAAVDGEIDRAGEECIFELLDEQALATCFGQRRVREPIAGRLDDGDFTRDSRGRFQQSRHRVRLEQRERTAARSEYQMPHADVYRVTGAALAIVVRTILNRHRRRVAF